MRIHDRIILLNTILLDKFYPDKTRKNTLKDLIKSAEDLSKDIPVGMFLNIAIKVLEGLEEQETYDKLDLKKISNYSFKEKNRKSILKDFKDTSGDVNRCDDLGITPFLDICASNLY
ncbi:hypothetical protein [Bacteroidetes bacterium endosymbiont of Geopemphigus sp.]|uniref:hypothetical protein n=1 Tax=Bacteroidetes bacterium endosymbiont of Geopemphigus sp. TaxID=2047937 RepID=UPI000CD10442|nr:hypothetical protein [Bacteroidetes bacterium endosymbiont of Geopemphigus sp.]